MENCKIKSIPLREQNQMCYEFQVIPKEQSLFIALGVSILIHAHFFKIINDSKSFQCLKSIFDIKEKSLSEHLDYIESCFKKMYCEKRTVQQLMFGDFELLNSKNVKTVSELMEKVIFKECTRGEVINCIDLFSGFANNYKISIVIKKLNLIDKEYHPDGESKVPRIYIKEQSNEEFSIMIIDEICFAIEKNIYYSFYSNVYYVNNLSLTITVLNELDLHKNNQLVPTDHLDSESSLRQVLDAFNRKIKIANTPCSICNSHRQCACHHENNNKICSPCKEAILKRICFICNNEKEYSSMATFNECWHSIHIKCLQDDLRCPCMEEA